MSSNAGASTVDDGWSVRTRSDDTVLRQYVRALASSANDLVAAQGGRTVVNEELALADLGGRAGFANSATVLRPPRDMGAIARAARCFADGERPQREQGIFYLWSAWPTSTELEGWTPAGYPPLMLRLPTCQPYVPDMSLDIQEVTTADHLREFEDTLADAYPLNREGWRRGRLFSPAALSSGWRFWLGRSEGTAVATAASFFHEGINTINYVSVAEPARGRRFASQITWAAAQAAIDCPTMLLSSSSGRLVYERMGFVAITRFSLWTYDRC